MRDVALIIHFIGLAMGLGTSFAFMFLGMGASKMETKEAEKFTLNAMVIGKMGHIGLTLLILSGIYLIIPYGPALFSMHGLLTKLVLVLVLGALIGIISSKAKKAAVGNTTAELKKIETLGKISLITSIIIVILAVITFH